MSSSSALLPPDIDFDSKEPWSTETELIIPVESTQVLIHESAAILGGQAFLNIAKLPYIIRERRNATEISPNNKLPVLRCGAYVVSELEGIVQLAQAKGVALSDHLNATQKADLRAYMSLVHNVLGNALTFLTWKDKDVYEKYTRLRAGSVYNFPLRVIMPWYIRRRVVAQLALLNWAERSSEEVFHEVETCLIALSERLGEGAYFFGDHPTELDALVFGYLFTMITTPLPNKQLGALVKQSPNLVKLCQHVEKEYFSQSVA
ncbi:Metaxin-2 [Orchesella cincta]|uniref:Metaxin-2 n=1 Tax=Orchesella cincta TaxID=48709 RepID=A0A1D2ML31_ORCCI|nr:Metaxin-2 [Orchesella cincta]